MSDLTPNRDASGNLINPPPSGAAGTADTGSAGSGGAGLTLLTNGQVANAFTMPNAGAIQNNIDSIANHPQVANQMAASPLAGITTLGQVANAGTTNAGVSQAGLAQAGLSQAGLAQAGNTAIDTGQSGALLGGQIANINQLNAQAQGVGPSVAQLQAKQQGEQNVANQMAMLASQRGAANSSLGLRASMEAKAKADQQAIQAGVQGRTAEEIAAQQQLTGALGGTQGQVMQGAQAQAGLNQDISKLNASAANTQLLQNSAAANQQMQNNTAAANQVGLANAGATNQVGLANAGAANTASLQNAAGQNQTMQQQGALTQQVQLANAQQQAQTTLANLQAKQQTQGLNAQEQNAMLQAQMTLANNESTVSQNYANAMINQNLTQQGINAGISINAANNQMGLLGAEIAGGSALGAAGVTALGEKASDRNLKTNIKSADRSMKDFLSQIDTSRVNASTFNLWNKE